jgi:rubrerythrin
MALLTGDEIIEIAVRLEERGETFYRAAAEKATAAEVVALFQDLAVQEQYHRQVFQKMGRDIVRLALSDEQWDEFEAYSRALLQQSFFDKPDGALSQAAEAEGERAALRAALGFEEETLGFFRQLRNVVRGAEQQVVDRIIHEEEQHMHRLWWALAAA